MIFNCFSKQIILILLSLKCLIVCMVIYIRLGSSTISFLLKNLIKLIKIQIPTTNQIKRINYIFHLWITLKQKSLKWLLN